MYKKNAAGDDVILIRKSAFAFIKLNNFATITSYEFKWCDVDDHTDSIDV